MRRTGSGEEKVTVAKAVPLWLRAAFGVVFALLLAAGVFFYRTQEQALRLDAESDLQTVAELKVGQIAQWRAERLSDGAELTERPFAKDAILRWLADPRSEDVGDILIRFRSLGEYHHYFDVLLVDARGEIRLSLSGRKGRLQEDALRNLAAALENRCATLSDLHAGPGDLPPHLDVIAPLISGAGATAVLKGAVVMQSDARQFLYPLIRIWPEASRSAETLLVRREGDQVLVLNDLRHRSDSALEFRIPLSRLDSPAVLAVMGREGVVEGMDYRGVEVLSALKAVPDSPWFMVAKIDKSEALAGWRTSSVLIVALILAFTAAAGGALLVIWQRNAKAHYRALYREEASRRESEQRYRTAQKALAEAEARFRIASQSASDLVWDWEIASHRLDWFGDIDKALGYPRGEFPRTIEAWDKVIHPDDRDRVMAALDRHLKTESPYLEEYRVRRKDGSVSYWRDSGSTLPDDKGKPYRMVGAVSDITERKRAEEALRESEEKYRSLVEQSLMGIAISLGNQVVFANPALLRILGYDDLEKFVKIPILDHVAPSSKEYIIARFDEVARGVPVPFEFEYNILRKDGVTRTLQATSTHFKLGDKTYTQTTFQDITERKSNEEKLKMALQEREVLLREIHHRVKNNIQIISSLLRLQSRSVKDETALDILNECQGRIRSIALIHEKLYQSQDFARIDFADYIQNMVIHLISFHSGVGGRVNFRLEAVDVKLDINQAMPCGLIVNELVTNVLKHAFPEGRKGDLIIRLGVLDGGRYQLAVRDTGVGLAQDIDLKNAETLGFQIVGDLVKQLEGSIEIVRDGGTEFILRF
jgi:PAS domain S-box-containing protein